MNDSQPNPSSTVLFLDATHQSKVTANLLRALDVNVEVHRRYYLPTAPDPQWIADATGRGWVIISGDKGIREDGINRYAVIKARAKVFLLADTNSRGAEWAASLVMARKKSFELRSKTTAPFIALWKKEVSITYISRSFSRMEAQFHLLQLANLRSPRP